MATFPHLFLLFFNGGGKNESKQHNICLEEFVSRGTKRMATSLDPRPGLAVSRFVVDLESLGRMSESIAGNRKRHVVDKRSMTSR